ncbi:MAG: T9SS type B sorting domain-containing protein, partial [Ferruginibacter sp.]
TYTITYTLAASGCNPAATNSTSITINPSLTAVTGFSYTSPVCANGINPVPITVAGFTTGGTFSSTPGLIINATSGIIDLLTSTPGTYLVTYTVAAATCRPSSTSTATITINSVTTPVTSFSYTSPVCSNAANPSPILAAGFTTGGTFTAPAGVTINATSGIIDLATTTPGTYTITYTLAASGCNPAATSTAPITINAIINPVTSFSYASPVCATGINPVPITAPGFTPGGTFSSTLGLSINGTTGVINLPTSAQGTYTVTYTIPADAATCRLASTSTATITINNVITPVTGFSYTSPICANATNPTPILASGFTSGGTFSAPAGVTINPVSGIINLTTTTPGTYTITYSLAVSGCNPAATNTASITINPSLTPVTGFSYTSPVCANTTNPLPITVTGFTTGGTYSAPPGLSINPATGLINLSVSTPGTYTVTYTLAATGCRPLATNTTSITITPVVIPITGFSYTTPVCANSGLATPILTPGFTTGGTFTSPGVSMVNATGVINTALTPPGTYTITYSVPPNGCNPSRSSTTLFTITPAITPTTGFSYATPFCQNAANPSPIPVAGFTAGGTYTAPSGVVINATTGQVNLASSTPGTYTINYAVGATGCNPAANSNTNITITPVVAPVTGFSYTSPVCANAVNQTPSTVAGFTTGGSFSAPAGLSINATTGIINVGASTPGSYTITYSVAAVGCNPAASNTASIIITPVVTPITGFSYASPFCQNAGNPAPTTVAGFTTGGTFSAPAGLVINAATGVINLAASTPGTYSVTYSVVANGCNPAANSNASVTITQVITPVTGFSYTTPICANVANQNPTTVAGFTTGGTFSAPAGLSINPTSGQINVGASTPGSYIVNYTVTANGCNPASTTTASITITPVITPITGFSYTTPICANATNPSPITVAGFTTGGTFFALPGLSINSATGIIDLASSTPGTYAINYTVAATGCNPASISNSSITINAPIAPTTGFSYASPVCANGTNPVPVPVAGFTTGGTYSAPAAVSINATTGAINLAASTPGTYTISYTVSATSCTPLGSSTTSITINPIITPETGFSYATPVCINGTNPSPVTVAGFTSGGTYSSTAGLSINASTGIIDLALSTAGSYTVTYSVSAAGCRIAGSSNTSIVILAAPLAITGFSYTSPVCSNGSNAIPIPVTGFTGGGLFTAAPAGLSINPNSGIINLAASTTGSYTITFSAGASSTAPGCLSAASSNANIVINPTVPLITNFSYPSPICINGGTTANPILGTGFSTGGVFSAPAGLNINAATGVVTVAGSIAGNYVVTYTVSNTCLTNVTGTAPISIGLIQPPVVNFPSVCISGPVTFNATGTGIFNWYSDNALTNLINTGNTFTTTIDRDTLFFVNATSNGCTSIHVGAQAFAVALPPVPYIGKDTAICIGDQLLLEPNNYNSTYQYLWNNGSTGSALLINQPGTYIVKATIQPPGCSSSDTINIGQYNLCDDIYFPTAFSPNGDGLNDQFGPGGLLAPVKKYSLIIFNRWGQIIFNTNNPARRWDGTFNGKKLDPANFVISAKYEYRGRKREKKANLLLIR